MGPIPGLIAWHWIALLTLGAAACAAVLTVLVRRYALQARLLDVPNARSSHVVPTPRGGGLSIVIVVLTGLPMLAAAGWIGWRSATALVLAGGILAVVGFVDDRRGLSARLRLLVQGAAAVLLVTLAGPLPSLGLPWLDVAPLIVPGAIVVLGLVWFINLYNFMDGIDGIAATEAICICAGAGAVAMQAGTAMPLPALALVGGASAGFLALNWPPARIFMGDVGSGFVGLVLGGLLLACLSEGVPMGSLVILPGVFIVDATFTLLRRVATGRGWAEAHRSHAYQRLSRRWGGHRSVTLAVLGVNVIWLIPLSIMAAGNPDGSSLIAVLAFAPLVLAAALVGAGSPGD